MLVLNEQDQRIIIRHEEVIDEVANSLKAFSEGKTDTPLRYVLPFNEGNRYLVMPKHYLMILKWLVLKQLHLRQIILKRQKTITGSVLLSDYETGETLAY